MAHRKIDRTINIRLVFRNSLAHRPILFYCEIKSYRNGTDGHLKLLSSYVNKFPLPYKKELKCPGTIYLFVLKKRDEVFLIQTRRGAFYKKQNVIHLIYNNFLLFCRGKQNVSSSFRNLNDLSHWYLN